MKQFHTKEIVTLGLLVAIHVVLSRFLSINAWNIKIGFAFVPVFVGASLYGPFGGMAVGAIGDFLGALLFPIGPYFPGFTLSCALTGLIFGLFLRKKQSIPRVMMAVAINQFGIGLFLTTFWISWLYQSPYWVQWDIRLFQVVVLFVVESVTILLMSKTLIVPVRHIWSPARRKVGMI